MKSSSLKIWFILLIVIWTALILFIKSTKTFNIQIEILISLKYFKNEFYTFYWIISDIDRDIFRWCVCF